MTPRVAAAIVNYNSGGELRQALAALAEARLDAWRAVVVDNASTDGSEQAALDFGSHVRLVRNTDNLGFARGINQAIRSMEEPHVLILNPDCRVSPDMFPPLQAVLDRDERCAIAAPRLLDPDGSLQGNARGDPGMLTGVFGRTAVLRRAGRALGRRDVLDDGGGGTMAVDWVSGACMLARRSALAEVGGFDERYFMYWEDADLCRRLRGHGYSVQYVPASTAVHRVGASSRTAPDASIRAFHESAYRYYATHVAPGAFNPRRWLARALLAGRCHWKLYAATKDTKSQPQRTQRTPQDPL